jgi:hypothetical protein
VGRRRRGRHRLPAAIDPATDGLSELIPPGSPAAHAESDAGRLFGFPLDAAVAVVQRDPRGLPTATQVRAVRQMLVPALVALFGRLGMWPGNRRTPQVRVESWVGAGAGSMGRPG